MAELIIFMVLGLIVFGPIAVALTALSSVNRLRKRLEEVERFAETRIQRLTERQKQLEDGTPPRVPAAPPPAPREPRPVEAPLEPVQVRPDLPATPFPLPPPRILLPPKPPPEEKPKESVPLENVIGERILPRIGVVALVLGMGLLVYYAYGKFGPGGRIALAGGTGAVMVVAGAFLRRHPHTQLLGGCLIGGGWAVIYVAAYAAHFVEASRIVDSKLLGFLILLGVSEAALVHALRYRNETITGIAYLLTIATLLLSPEPGPPAWLAMGLSAAVLVALAWREKWIRLCTFGATLLYVAEVAWLSRTPPADILPALAVLVALWMLWILPDYFHRPATDWARRIHGLLVAINFGGLLVVGGLIHRWFDLENMGWVWLTLGALYGVNAVAGRKAAWRPAYLAYLGFGAVLAGVGSHLLLHPGLGAPFAWMAISAALFAWGLWRKEESPRLMGVAGAACTFLRFWFVDRRLEFAFAPALAVAAGLYALSAVIGRLRRTGSAGESESGLIRPLSHLGALALGLAIWTYPPELTEAMLLAAAGVGLLLLGPRLGVTWLVGEGMCFLMVALFFMATSTLPATGDVLGVSRRIAATVPVLVGWLVAGWVYPKSEPQAEKARVILGACLFAGVLALLGFELRAGAPVAWAIACGAWFAWSRLARRDFEFVLAAVGAAATVVAYTLTSPLQVPGIGWMGAVPSGATILAIFVVIHLASRREAPGAVHSTARDAVAGAVALTGFVLLAHEMTGTWLTGSWALLGFALAGYGFLFRDRVSRWSSLLILGVCLGKVAIFDLATFDMPVKIATLLTLGAVMVALSFVYARHHRRIVVYLAAKE
ncbi:MAG TPA: DUF2339 domain-containing protein [Planctomycetota bacterium]|nr:DUF2339 domain-containing protein [Planctomycetota bacterium]